MNRDMAKLEKEILSLNTLLADMKEFVQSVESRLKELRDEFAKQRLSRMHETARER